MANIKLFDLISGTVSQKYTLIWLKMQKKSYTRKQYRFTVDLYFLYYFFFLNDMYIRSAYCPVFQRMICGYESESIFSGSFLLLLRDDEKKYGDW